MPRMSAELLAAYRLVIEDLTVRGDVAARAEAYRQYRKTVEEARAVLIREAQLWGEIK